MVHCFFPAFFVDMECNRTLMWVSWVWVSLLGNDTTSDSHLDCSTRRGYGSPGHVTHSGGGFVKTMNILPRWTCLSISIARSSVRSLNDHVGWKVSAFGISGCTSWSIVSVDGHGCRRSKTTWLSAFNVRFLGVCIDVTSWIVLSARALMYRRKRMDIEISLTFSGPIIVPESRSSIGDAGEAELSTVQDGPFKICDGARIS